MEGPVQERDWKYLRSIHDEMLNELCSRIMKKAVQIAEGKDGTAHERYLKLYRHIKMSDDIVAECFNDWRRSVVSRIILSLRKHRLLTDQRLMGFSEDAQDWLHSTEELLGISRKAE